MKKTGGDKEQKGKKGKGRKINCKGEENGGKNIKVNK